MIKTREELFEFLPNLLNLKRDTVELSIDCEGGGTGLSRYGTLTHFTMSIKSLQHTWVFYTKALGPALFKIPGNEGQSLRSVLESLDIIQLAFDWRNDANALFFHFGIRIGRPRDVQLMELITRYGSRSHVRGLEKCVQTQGKAFMTQQELDNC